MDEISPVDSGLAVHELDPGSNQDGQFWAMWRGPQGNGVVPDQPLPTQWSNETNIVWRTDVPGRGHSSPSVYGDRIYLATADNDAQLVLSFDRTNGQQAWSKQIHSGGFPSSGQMHPKSTHANGTCACDQQRVYAAFLNSNAITVTALTRAGEIDWQTKVGEFVSKFGYAPSPILYKSVVIVAADNSGGGYIAALDRESGKIVWRSKRPRESSYSSPAIHRVGGQDQLLISGCGMVESIDPMTGKQNWKTDCVADATCGTIVASEDTIFASGGYPQRETVALDANGKQLWSQKVKAYEPSMLYHNQRLFLISDDGIAYCWNSQTGDEVWKKRLGGNFSGSPIICNDTIYVPNLSGKTYVFQNTDDRFSQVAVNQLGDDCYSSPAVVDGQILMRVGIGSGGQRREQLVCLGADATP